MASIEEPVFRDGEADRWEGFRVDRIEMDQTDMSRFIGKFHYGLGILK